MLRVFIALTPPTTLRQAAAEVREVFQPLNLPWRWVTPEQIHLTLRFLGNVPAAHVTMIVQAMARVAQGRPAFTVCARSLGCFPHPARPRVLWIGLTDHSQALEHLHACLTAELLRIGFPPEARPFHPHLTLARAHNTMRSSQLFPVLQTYQNRCFGEFSVTQLHLWQSQLRSEGALHTMLHSVTLQS